MLLCGEDTIVQIFILCRMYLNVILIVQIIVWEYGVRIFGKVKDRFRGNNRLFFSNPGFLRKITSL